MDVLIGQLATGLSLGSILLLAALGLALTFGQMGVINMAHGEFIMAGCYTAFVVQKFVSNAGASLLISLVVGFVVGGLLGVLLEVTLIQRMYDRPLDTLLVTFGVGLILQQVARNLFGAPAVNVIAAVRRCGDPRSGGAQDPDLHPGARHRVCHGAGCRSQGQSDGPPDPRRRAEPGSR